MELHFIFKNEGAQPLCHVEDFRVGPFGEGSLVLRLPIDFGGSNCDPPEEVVILVVFQAFLNKNISDTSVLWLGRLIQPIHEFRIPVNV